MPGSRRGQDCGQCPATAVTESGTLAALADQVGAHLLAQGETVAVAEATSGGLVSAALQGVPRASRFYQASITIYSAVAGRELLPKAVRDKVFVRDYSDPAFTADEYKQSKITYVLEMAKHVQARFDATYGVAESGAAQASGLGRKLRPAGAFTAICVFGNGRSDVIIYDSPEREDRRGNMQRFAAAALRQLLATISAANPPLPPASRL